MPARAPLVNRPLAGWLGVLCLFGGLLVVVFDEFENPWGGSLIRVGLVVIVFWIALPTPTRPAAWTGISPWLTVGVVVLAFIAVRRPLVVIPLAAALILAVLILMPKRRS